MPYKNIFQRIKYEKQYGQKNRQRLRSRSRAHYLKNPEPYKERARLRRITDPEGKKEKDRLYYQRNKEKIKNRAKQYYQKNKEAVLRRAQEHRLKNQALIKEKDKRYFLKNKDKINAMNRAYHRKHRAKLLLAQKEYRLKNRAKLHEGQRRYFEKKPEAFIALRLRQRLYKILGGQKPQGTSVFKLFGCSLPTLRRHIENQFEKGMTWENRGKVWHVDHIVPMTHFEDKVAASHYSNLRPMFAKRNLQKGARVAGFFVFRGKRLAEYTP
jgi:hypothetical protein